MMAQLVSIEAGIIVNKQKEFTATDDTKLLEELKIISANLGFGYGIVPEKWYKVECIPVNPAAPIMNSITLPTLLPVELFKKQVNEKLEFDYGNVTIVAGVVNSSDFNPDTGDEIPDSPRNKSRGVTVSTPKKMSLGLKIGLAIVTAISVFVCGVVTGRSTKNSV